jgi:hypothetical protein
MTEQWAKHKLLSIATKNARMSKVLEPEIIVTSNVKEARLYLIMIIDENTLNSFSSVLNSLDDEMRLKCFSSIYQFNERFEQYKGLAPHEIVSARERLYTKLKLGSKQEKEI